MFLQRSATALARRAPIRVVVAKRSFASTVVRRNQTKQTDQQPTKQPAEATGKYVKLDDVKSEDDLLAPGAKAGTVPTDYEQSTGLERLELLGKMEGRDIFDMRPLDSSRKGTLDNPIILKSAGDEHYACCTGIPADTHPMTWLTMSRDRPLERCSECGNCLKMEYIGVEDHGHDEHHEPPPEPKTMADYVKPEYWYR